MTIDLPSWVPEFEEEYSKFKKKGIFGILGFVLVALGFLIIVIFNEIIENNEVIKYSTLAITFLGFFLIGAYTNRKLPRAPKYLASMIYSIGYNLDRNSDPESAHYIYKMDKYLKDCNGIIENVESSLNEALYVNNTREYLNNLKQLIGLLNEYYIHYSKCKNFPVSYISANLMSLADIMRNDKGYITPEHSKLITSLIQDLKSSNINEKPIYISRKERIISKIKILYQGTPYNLKLVIYIMVVSFIVYELIYYLALDKGILPNTAFGYAIGGSIAALVPAIMIKDHILK